MSQEINNNNCKKYLLLTIIFNPLLIMFLGLLIWGLVGGGTKGLFMNNFYSSIVAFLTTLLIISTLIIPIKLFKLKKNGLIGINCFIFIFILWVIPFLLALLASGTCSISAIIYS